MGRLYRGEAKASMVFDSEPNAGSLWRSAARYNCYETRGEELLRSRQRALLMGFYCAIAYPAFYLLDCLVYPSLADKFIWIRAIVAVFGLVPVVLSRIPTIDGTFLRRMAQLAAITATGGVGLMCSLAEGLASIYLIGLILCFLAITTIELFAPIALAGALAFLLGVYFVFCLIWGPPATIAVIASAFFFGVGAYFFCTVAGLLLFVQRLRIQMAKHKIVEQKAEIEKAYNHQRDFLATMTHELRSPLHSILGFTELVVERESGLKEKSRNNLARLEQCARQLLTLINDMLDLSKIESGRFEVESSRADIRPVLEEVVESTRALLGSRPVEVCLHAPPQLEIVSDTNRIRQILTNLASNAAKFTVTGEISLVAESSGEGVKFVVRDTGIGVPDVEQQEIFSAFAQGRNVQGCGGTGLGLSIVTRLTQCLGGIVSMNSKVGEGSCFTVVLPNLISERKAA